MSWAQTNHYSFFEVYTSVWVNVNWNRCRNYIISAYLPVSRKKSVSKSDTLYTRSVTIHPLHRWIDLHCHDPATLICARQVGLPGNKKCWNCKKSIVSILGNCILALRTANLMCVFLALLTIEMSACLRCHRHMPRSSTNLRMTTKRSIADDREDGEQGILKPPFWSSVWKHFRFCKDR